MGVGVKNSEVTGLAIPSVPPKSVKKLVIRIRFSGLASSRPMDCRALRLYYLGSCDLVSHDCAHSHECKWHLMRPTVCTVSLDTSDGCFLLWDLLATIRQKPVSHLSMRY